MTEHYVTAREHWLEEAIDTTRSFIDAERAENAYDLVHAAPGTLEYEIAIDSKACVYRAETTLSALEAELSEVRRRAELRRRR